eukprot:4046470-Pyramimonas_sp.AAC.1
MSSYGRCVLVDSRALNDPTPARHIGHRPNILRNSVENEHFVGVAECVGSSSAKNASSQSVCMVAICRSVLRRSVAGSWGVKQFVKQCDIECSSVRLSRREWPK